MDTPVYQYVLQKQDFINAQHLYLRHNRRAALSYYFWIWLVPILGVVIFLIAATAYLLHQEVLFHQIAPLAGMGIWFAIFIPLMRWFNIRKLWKASVETIDGGKPVSLQFDNEQISSSIPGKSEGRFYWNAILDFAEDDRVAMIFVRAKNFLYIPKNALPEEAWTQIRALAPRKK
jgi:hypothetical protein